MDLELSENARSVGKLALGMCLAAAAVGLLMVLNFVLFFNDGSASDRHGQLSDWEQAESMARLFDLEWPASTHDVYFAKDVWFHHAYEVRVQMATADATMLVEAASGCDPVTTIPAGFINEDWWKVAEAQAWIGCQTDASVGWSNWIVADFTNEDAATVYLAHFQPDT